MEMTVLPKAISRFDPIPVEWPMAFFMELEQKISQFVWRHRGPSMPGAVLGGKNGAGGIRLPDYRLCYTATVSKTVWYWHRIRNMDQ